MAFKGVKPSGQPRTLRGIAEDKGTVPAGFVSGDLDPATLLPKGMPGASQTYKDGQGENVVAASKPISPAPFANVKRGR